MTVETQTADESYRERVQTAISALDAHGVSEDMIRREARFSPETWSRFKESSARITSVELVYLSGALCLESIYLLTGDDRNRIAFSPCTWASIIKSVYPESEVKP